MVWEFLKLLFLVLWCDVPLSPDCGYSSSYSSTPMPVMVSLDELWVTAPIQNSMCRRRNKATKKERNRLTLTLCP